MQGCGLYPVRAVCGHASILHQQHLPASVHDHQGSRQVAQEHESRLQGLPAGLAQQEPPTAFVVARPPAPPLYSHGAER